MADPPRVFFYVQHLLGVGHLMRAARVAKALAARGFTVLVAMGGEGMAEIDVGDAAILRLPPVRAGVSGFSAIVHPDGRPFDAAAQAERSALLGAAFDRFAPDILITEAFPFGRRQMRFELLPLLERARARARPPLVAASIRDIVQANRAPDRVAETLAHIDRFFDLVLVHGDPRLARLDDSFPEASRFAEKIIYTGLVAPMPLAQEAMAPRYAAVISAGGGAVGAPLLRAALRALPMTRLAGRPALFLTGPNMPAALREDLARAAGSGAAVLPFVPDLAKLLGAADLSISQAGYNTVADVLVAGCRAVLVPFATGGETEQSTRAHLLDRLGLAVPVSEAELAPATLAAAIERALDRPPAPHGLDLDGAAATVRILAERLRRGRPPQPSGTNRADRR